MFLRRVAAEIQARCRGYAGLFQQVAGQREAVVGQRRTIAIEVEGAFRAGRDAEADGFQRRGQEVAAVPSHQLDARRDLSAAEQGIYADLPTSRYFNALVSELVRTFALQAGTRPLRVLDACAAVMVLTPVCAHSIHAVPLVFSASRTLTVVAEATNRDSVYASADSHSRCDLQPGESLTITTAVEQLGLITFDETEQFRAIETKLMRR